MTEFKFKIDDNVTFKDCSVDFQLDNWFPVKHRKVVETKVEIDNEIESIYHNSYSYDGTGWFPESCLEKV